MLLVALSVDEVELNDVAATPNVAELVGTEPVVPELELNPDVATLKCTLEPLEADVLLELKALEATPDTLLDEKPELATPKISLDEVPELSLNDEAATP